MSDHPIRIAHPDDGFAPDLCGSTALSTPVLAANRPNLSAVAFRTGDHASFKASMLTGLASSAHPALAALGTREDDDFSIALIDAWASACDVLTFYQERLANEAFMGTATERLSINELSRLIGYRLHPGAAAETDLVLLMEDPPAAPPDVADLRVPAGTRVQSQPGPEEDPQVFETLADLDARVAWNAFRPRTSRAALPSNGDIGTWVDGSSTLQVGDVLLFLGRERWDSGFTGFDADSTLWNMRRVTQVEPAPDGSRTRIVWDVALDSVDSSPDGPTAGLRLFHLQDRASLFGFNAPHPLTLSTEQRTNYGFNSGNQSDWAFAFDDQDRIHLDNIYKRFIEDSWIVLEAPGTNNLQAFRIQARKDDSKAEYAIAGKALRLALDTDKSSLGNFENKYRKVSVYGGSAEILLAEKPVVRWVAGSEIEIGTRADDLPSGRRLILTGRRAMLENTGQPLMPDYDDGVPRTLEMGAVFTLLDEPEDLGGGLLDLRLIDEDGFTGSVEAHKQRLQAYPAPEENELLSIVRTLDSVTVIDAGHSRLALSEPLGLAFDRTSLVIHANVARAAHGEGAVEILGHGDPSQPFQKFVLKQAPVTHRLAATETGTESTLSVRIDGVEWDEVPDLYDRGATARVFKTALMDDGRTVIEFGDGISGARPPAGRDNIVAEHSRGLGADGNLRAGQLKLPLDRPLGLKETNNPLPATGGADAEAADDARRNAPIYTLTLGRVVSLTDYRDFALGYPGIARAEARWVWQGETRRIVVTVAGDDGAEVLPGSTTHDNLLEAFRALGDPLVSVELLSYQPATFHAGLRVAVDTAYQTDAVLAATEAHLRQAFSFDARDFGQVLSLSELAAAAHAVPGLLAVDIDLLYRSTPPQAVATRAYARLTSRIGRLGAGGMLLPAEILTLDPGPLDKLEVMA